MRVTLCILLCTCAVLSNAQFSGVYRSSPDLEGIDHFKLHHHHEHAGKYQGTFSLKAFYDKGLLWEESAKTIEGADIDDLILQYGEGEEILSVHEMKLFWDGEEWEFFMLGYLDDKNHGAFIVVEEVFSDNTETELIETKSYRWLKSHKHL